MTDSDLLKLLATLGMDDLSFRVLPVLPVLRVAWADGEVQPAEREAVRAFAARFAPGREGQLLIDCWLRYEPSNTYVERGLAALSALAGRESSPLALSANVLDQVRDAAREVAKAHGGFFGIGSISRSEADALEVLRLALDARDPHPPHEIEPRRRVTITCSTSTFDPSAQSAVVVPDGSDERAPIEADGLFLGSAPGVTIRIDDPTVAARHSRVFYESRRFYIEDLDSPTGTFVDGERVAKRRLLGGERLRIGPATLTFKLLRRIPLQMIS